MCTTMGMTVQTCKNIYTRFFLPLVKSYLRHTRFVREIIDVETGVKSWQEVPPELEEGEREVIWINQDESLCYAC